MGKASRRKSGRARDPAPDTLGQSPRESAADIRATSDWLPGEPAWDGSDAGSRPGDSPEAGWRQSTGDQRALERLSHRELDRISASLCLPGGKGWIPVQIRDFTSIGFGVWYRPGTRLEGGLPPDPILARAGTPPGPGRAGGAPADWKTGDEAEFRVRLGSGREYQVWCQVKNVGAWRDGWTIGLRRLDVAFPQIADAERRAQLRLGLSPTLSLKARVRHPFLFGHWCQLLTSDLNKDLGFSFLCSDPAILLFEGMVLEVFFELAAFRQEPLKARVTWVHATAANEVKFGVECVSVHHSLHNALCDYLLFAQYWTPARLRQAGFQPKRVREHLRFSSVRTMEDYAEVLYLRRDAYVGAGKRPQGTRPEHMSTPLDGRSRILMAKHHGKLVGTLTYSFPANEDTVLDSQAGFPGCKYPVALPPKMNLIEVSRLCIDESYRGTDLLVGMFEHGLKHFLMSDRHWLVTSATDELLPTYQRIGFVKLKASYKHPLLNYKEHHLIIAHRSAFLWGFGMSLFIWNSVFGDLIRHLVERGLISLPGWTRAVIRVKLLLRPLARQVVDAKARLAFRKHLEALRAEHRTSGRTVDAGEPVTADAVAVPMERLVPGVDPREPRGEKPVPRNRAAHTG